jgi:retron-type reverse transcriptase
MSLSTRLSVTRAATRAIDLDKELTRRGHRFCRYADDCNIYVRSRRAGERVMASVSRFLTQKHSRC